MTYSVKKQITALKRERQKNNACLRFRDLRYNASQTLSTDHHHQTFDNYEPIVLCSFELEHHIFGIDSYIHLLHLDKKKPLFLKFKRIFRHKNTDPHR